MEPRLTFYPIGESYFLVAGVILTLLLLWRVFPISQQLSRRRRRVLTILRFATIVVVLFVMLRPTLVYLTKTKQSASIVLLIDQSPSMSVPDEVGGKTRFEALGDVINKNAAVLRKLSQDVEIKAYAFDSELYPISVENGVPKVPETTHGNQTAIGAVLEDAIRELTGQRVLGIVLLSDGAQRALYPRDIPPQPAAQRLRSLDQPLYGIRFGRAQTGTGGRDIVLEDLFAPDRVFVKNELNVGTYLRAVGYTNRAIPVQLLFETEPGKSEIVETQIVTPETSDERIPVRFRYIPEITGERKVSVVVPAQPGEALTTNNEQSTLVKVLAGGIKVLYVEGALRVEQRFLRKSLDASPDIHVDYVRLDLRGREGRPADMVRRLQPGTYDVYFLGDVDATLLQPEELASLAEAVSRGAGLLMLGGLQSFGAGGYAETPLAAVLPIRMNRFERQQPNEPIRKDLHTTGPVRMIPTPMGLRHFAMTLSPSPSENERLWQSLPPLDGANRWSGIKPGSIVLAEDENRTPLLVAQFYAQGRVIAFAGDSTWRWCLHGFETAHKRFWRQLTLWLAKKEDTQQNPVWIHLAQRQVPLGERLFFEVGAGDPLGEPITNVAWQVEIVSPDGKRNPVAVRPQGKTWQGEFVKTSEPGDYRVEIQATQNGQLLGQDKARFVVVKRDVEMDQPASDPGLLAALAATSGGRSCAPEELPDVLSELQQKIKELEVPIATRKTLWDRWPVLLLFVALTSVEWFLRKRWGLV
ncbi:MAG: hypothetical protein ACUVQR_03120 [Thermogutta sp.]